MNIRPEIKETPEGDFYKKTISDYAYNYIFKFVDQAELKTAASIPEELDRAIVARDNMMKAILALEKTVSRVDDPVLRERIYRITLSFIQDSFSLGGLTTVSESAGKFVGNAQAKMARKAKQDDDEKDYKRLIAAIKAEAKFQKIDLKNSSKTALCLEAGVKKRLPTRDDPNWPSQRTIQRTIAKYLKRELQK